MIDSLIVTPKTKGDAAASLPLPEPAAASAFDTAARPSIVRMIGNLFPYHIAVYTECKFFRKEFSLFGRK